MILGALHQEYLVIQSCGEIILCTVFFWFSNFLAFEVRVAVSSNSKIQKKQFGSSRKLIFNDSQYRELQPNQKICDRNISHRLHF